MKREQMLERLGLPEDATDADVVKATLEKPDALAEPPKETTETKAETTPEAVAASGKAPEGFVLVDKDTFEQIKAGSAAGLKLAADAKVAERDDEIKAAVKAGKFAVGRREHYEKAWDADPEGTKALIASLAPGLVPVSEMGRAGDGEGGSSADEEAIVAAAEAMLLPELAASHTSTLSRVIATTTGGAS